MKGTSLGINILGTLLLGVSNSCDQPLSAPLYTEVVRAHTKSKWLNIGVPNTKNLWHIVDLRNHLDVFKKVENYDCAERTDQYSGSLSSSDGNWVIVTNLTTHWGPNATLPCGGSDSPNVSIDVLSFGYHHVKKLGDWYDGGSLTRILPRNTSSGTYWSKTFS